MGNVEITHEQRFAQPYSMDKDILIIHPTAFVEELRARIDSAFANRSVERAQA